MASVLDQIPLVFLPVGCKNPRGESLDKKAQGSMAWSLTHRIKQDLSLIANNLTGPISSLASPLRHFPNQLAKLSKTMSKFAGPVEGFAWTSDLCELVNSAQWTFNGGLVTDVAKGYYCSIIANVALLPTNLLTIVWYCRDFDIASFEFLGKAATAIGNIRIFSFVGSIAVGPTCMTTLCVAYAFFGAHSVQKWMKYSRKAAQADWEIKEINLEISCNGIDRLRIKKLMIKQGKIEAELYKAKNIIKSCSHEEKSCPEEEKSIDLNDRIADLEGQAKVIKDELNEIDLEKKLASWKVSKIHREHKLLIAKWDFWTSIAKFILNAVILCGMVKIAAVSTVAASVPAMAILGALAILCAGRCLYLHWSYKKPTIDQV